VGLAGVDLTFANSVFVYLAAGGSHMIQILGVVAVVGLVVFLVMRRKQSAAKSAR
jgi:hypothetical protein